MSYTNITNIGIQHTDAIRGLSFYKEEINILEERLFEVASKNNSFEARQGIEHFQNQFVIQHNNIHDLRHKFERHEANMAADANMHMGRVNQVFIEEEQTLLNDYKSLEKVIKELRREFNQFLSKWM